jgi:hypothetical protein
VDQGPPHKTSYTGTNRKESGEEPRGHGHRGKFPEQTPIAYAFRSRIDKWDLIKFRSFCEAKDIVHRTKWQPTGLISNIQRTEEDSRQPNNPILKMRYRGKQRILT